MAFIPLIGHVKAWPIVTGYILLSPYSGSSYPLAMVLGMCLRWLGKSASTHAAKRQASFADWYLTPTRIIGYFLAHRPFRHALSVAQAGRSKETYPLLEALWKI
jgi:hypothetical protein